VAIGLLFVGILALNSIADRFWCRYFCPLGSLLGLLSKFALLRPVIGSACNRCANCVGVCRVEAIETQKGYSIVPSECTVCLDCLAACRRSGIGFQWRLSPAAWQPYDPTRRQALIALTASAASVALLRTGVQGQQPHPFTIRPPGANHEPDFLSTCIRCSQCIKVCPTSGLQLVLFETGWEGLWTPKLVPRVGYCAFDCNACGQVCPSGAIPNLDLETKRHAGMGVAVVDRNRCLPWANGIPCIVCEEMCPVASKAIRLEEVVVTDDAGEPATVQRPYVLRDLCIGCGICEYQCPVEGEAAIRVYRVEAF
jgi:MauM/NapG family ferredoxin protein